MGREEVLEVLRDAAMRAAEGEPDVVMASQMVGIAMGIQLALHGDMGKLMGWRDDLRVRK